jgi:hypothetical protein
MDNSRDADLAALHKRFNDYSLSRTVRERAYRTFQNIQAQVKDRKLVELRHRLVKAHVANDVEAVERFEGQIREHIRKTGRFLSEIA